MPGVPSLTRFMLALAVGLEWLQAGLCKPEILHAYQDSFPGALGIQRQMWSQILMSMALLSQRCAGCLEGRGLGGGGPMSQGRREVSVCVPVSPRHAYKAALSRRAVGDSGARFGCNRLLLPGWESGGVGRGFLEATRPWEDHYPSAHLA